MGLGAILYFVNRSSKRTQVVQLGGGVWELLSLANMGVIKNLCGLNWIIEPLGAELKPVYVYTSDNPCALLCTDNPQFEICYKQDWLEGCGSGDICRFIMPPTTVPAYWIGLWSFSGSA